MSPYFLHLFNVDRAERLDMGILRVEVIGAKNIMAGDRSGKSDVGPPSYCLPDTDQQPYVTFNLNGNRVFKSETKKK